MKPGRMISLFFGILLGFLSSACGGAAPKPQQTVTDTKTQLSIESLPGTITPTHSPTSTNAPPSETTSSKSTVSTEPSLTSELSGYGFPDSIDSTKRYLFYLHGKIIEDQGLQAVSQDFGAYEYQAILDRLTSFGFTVLSEQRAKDTVAMDYAHRIAGQINRLLQANVPPGHITVVGASKGAIITAMISYFSQNPDLNFVLLGTCHPEMVTYMQQNQMSLAGNVLAIYDFADVLYSGSCQDLFSFSEGKGLSRHEEIVLQVGTGHGVLYKPLDEWILPAVDWANSETK
jgi:hypothetical protein